MFNESCRILIDTDTGFKEGSPHLVTTAINYYHGSPSEVDFNYQDVYNREDDYHDVVGFYHTHPSGMDFMSQTDVETMTQWVKCLGKSLVCLIETDKQINGWIFRKDDYGKITHNELSVVSNNDVNYDIWLKKKGNFWDPADFLFEPDIDKDMDHFEMLRKLEDLNDTQKLLLKGIGDIQSSMLELIGVLRNER